MITFLSMYLDFRKLGRMLIFLIIIFHCPFTPQYEEIQKPPETDLLMYVQNDIPFKVLDFVNTNIESLWIEVHSSCKSSSSIVIGFLYRHPKCTSKWFDDFCELMDSIWLLGKEILLLGDFNINLLNVNHSNWQNITRSYNLSQCITLPTRITHSSRTLSYSSKPSSLIEMCIPCIGVSDHYTTCVTWSKKISKYQEENIYQLHFGHLKDSILPLSCQI